MKLEDKLVVDCGIFRNLISPPCIPVILGVWGKWCSRRDRTCNTNIKYSGKKKGYA